MDIVKRLKLIGIGSEINSVSNDRAVANEAADEIERLREAMLEIVYLIGDSSRRQEIMDIAKPWAIQQVAYIDARAALKEKE